MASPIIIDDGGSTRIKRLLTSGFGAMDSLLDVDESLNPPKSDTTVNGPFRQLKIAYIDKDGDPHKSVDSPLLPGDSFTVTSNNSQTVTVDIDANADGIIRLIGVGGNVPLVEAKQFKKKRRYVVANAGPILVVDGVAGGVAFRMDAVTLKSIYTSVVIL